MVTGLDRLDGDVTLADAENDPLRQMGAERRQYGYEKKPHERLQAGPHVQQRGAHRKLLDPNERLLIQ